MILRKENAQRRNEQVHQDKSEKQSKVWQLSECHANKQIVRMANRLMESRWGMWIRAQSIRQRVIQPELDHFRLHLHLHLCKVSWTTPVKNAKMQKKKNPFIPLVLLNSTFTCLTFAQQQDVRGETCDGNASPGCPQPNTCIYKRTHLSHKLFRAPSSRKTPQWNKCSQRARQQKDVHEQPPLMRTVSASADVAFFFLLPVMFSECQVSILISFVRCGKRSRSTRTRRLQKTGRSAEIKHNTATRTFCAAIIPLA